MVKMARLCAAQAIGALPGDYGPGRRFGAPCRPGEGAVAWWRAAQAARSAVASFPALGDRQRIIDTLGP